MGEIDGDGETVCEGLAVALTEALRECVPETVGEEECVPETVGEGETEMDPRIEGVALGL